MGDTYNSIEGSADTIRWFCESEWFLKSSSSKRNRLLQEATKRVFCEKDFLTFEYTDLSPEQEERLFGRVQMGLQLTVAEKMSASTGPWQDLAKQFVATYPAVYSLLKDTARGKDLQLTLSCFSQIVECTHPTSIDRLSPLKINHQHLQKLLANRGALSDDLRAHLVKVWTAFNQMMEEDAYTFTNKNKYLQGYSLSLLSRWLQSPF